MPALAGIRLGDTRVRRKASRLGIALARGMPVPVGANRGCASG